MGDYSEKRINEPRFPRLRNSFSTPKILCPYCNKIPEIVTGDILYPHRKDLKNRNFYLCAPCDAYVGCHAPSKKFGDGTIPLGRLAKAGLRRLKAKAHKAFDPLWQNTPQSRDGAYRWLAAKLEIPLSECHIGMFNDDLCTKTIEICEAKIKELKNG